MASNNKSAPGEAAKPPSLWQLIWNSRWQVLRAWLWFGGSFAVLLQLLIWARPFTDHRLTVWIANLTAWVMRVAGAEGKAHGTLVSSSFGTVEIVRECTGVYPTALFIAAVLAYPTHWKRTLLGIAVGIVSLQGMNIVRVISLAYIHKAYPEHFETAHLIVWQSLMVFFALIVWLVWAVELTGSRGRHAT